MSNLLLEIKNLSLDYILQHRQLRALDKISFRLDKGQVLGVAGESGCGKSTLGLSIIRLLPKVAKIKQGEIFFNGHDLMKLSEKKMNQEIRGKKITMIFQNPGQALNPVFKVRTQMLDVLRQQSNDRKRGKSKRKFELLQKAIGKLAETGIASPSERISNYPFEFSGGMKQRVMISMALSSKTSLLIADEPTSALDVTIEAQIIELLKELYTKYKTSILYISHDLGILSKISNRIMIMYAGRIIEMGNTKTVLRDPNHPYTMALLGSFPDASKKTTRLFSLPGFVPPLDQLPTGCAFHPRCRFAEKICQQEIPNLIEVSPDHCSACLLDLRNQLQW
jgi:peptide/nickel transport system ATP-binding protein